MKQEIQEQLSALMDGQLARDEARFVLKRVGSDTQMVACWTRYHVTRQVLRRQPLYPTHLKLAANVMQAIANDVPLRARGPWLRWASGGAIAASVAVAALMVSHPTGDAPLENSSAVVGGNASSASPTPSIAAAASSPAEFQTPLLQGAPSQMAAIRSEGDPAEPVSFDPHLQSYLMRHYEATGAAGESSFLPYVLLVVPPQQAAANTRPEYSPQHH